MKKNDMIILAVCLVAGMIQLAGCNSKRKPGKIYMPDMTYSRAVETYAPLDSLNFTADYKTPGAKIYYNRKPVLGTIERNELFPYTLPNDSNGYRLSAQVKIPCHQWKDRTASKPPGYSISIVVSAMGQTGRQMARSLLLVKWVVLPTLLRNNM